MTSGKYEKMTIKGLKNAGINGIVLVEPRPRNTAPAILYAAIYLLKSFEDSIMIVLPVDHYIKKKNVKVIKIIILFVSRNFYRLQN